VARNAAASTNYSTTLTVEGKCCSKLIQVLIRFSHRERLLRNVSLFKGANFGHRSFDVKLKKA
jgi:hypothetical protein